MNLDHYPIGVGWAKTAQAYLRGQTFGTKTAAFGQHVGPFPPAPTGLAITDNGDGTASVSWTGVNPANSFAVYRGSSATALALIGTPASSPFTDTGLVTGTYYYAVAGVCNRNSEGNCCAVVTKAISVLTVVLSDTFTDTNGTSLASHTPTYSSGSYTWSIDTGAVQIQSNGAEGTTYTESSVLARANINTGYTAHTYVANITYKSAGPAVLYLITRYVDTNNFCYGFFGASLVATGDKVGGSYTTRTTNSATTTDSTDYTLTLTTTSSSVTIAISGGNSSSNTSYTTNNTGTKIGLMFQSNDSVNHHLNVKDISVTA